MKTSSKQRKAAPFRAAFTLIELLVVLAILGILMAMMVPAAGLIMKRMAKARTQSDANIVASVLLKYQAEYNRWPSAYLPEGLGESNAEWVDLMAPKPEENKEIYMLNNPKRIGFFEPGGGALAASGDHAGAFVDAWGKPFAFRVDVEGAGEMANPNVDVGGMLRARTLAWSAGPDGDLDTWEDNVTGWQ